MSLRWGNCLLFAFGKWLLEGGYLICRRSRHGNWPHFLWSADLKVFEQFRPPVYREGLWFPRPLYRGTVTQWTAEESP